MFTLWYFCVIRYILAHVWLLPFILSFGVPPTKAAESLVCHSSWYKYEDNCFWFSDYNTTRDLAAKECQSSDATLVTINSPGCNAFVHDLIPDGMNYDYWIGLRIRHLIETYWHWTNGIRFFLNAKYIHWCDEHPTKLYTPHTACAVVDYSFSRPCLRSYVCTTNRSFICEKDDLHTCPNNWFKHSHGSDTKCYYVNMNKMNHMDAGRFCFQKGARLVTVSNTQAQVYIRDYGSQWNEVHWVGLSPYQWDEDIDYKWHNWDEDGPNIAKKCTQLLSNGKWRHARCSEMHNFICAKGAVEAIDRVSSIEITTLKQSVTGHTSTETETYIELTRSGKQTSNPVWSENATWNSSEILNVPVDSDENVILFNLLIGIYSAVGVTALVFVGLLSKYLSLRRRSRLASKGPIGIEIDYDICDSVDNYKLYDNPEYVSAEHQEPSTSSMMSTLQTNEQTSGHLHTRNHEKIDSKLVNTNTDDDTAPEDVSKNTDMVLEDISLKPKVINGDVYAIVNRSRLKSTELIPTKRASNDK